VGWECGCRLSLPDAGELFNSGQLKNGDKLLMMVPESARFNYAYTLMTVVEL
jgi:hypothetical protein